MKFPKIVAECGSNWRHLNDCLSSIHLAAKAGADSVKFQLYTGKELYGFEKDMPGSLPPEWLPILKNKADQCGIEFMCTAFSPEGYDLVDPYVQTHKVASAEATHIRVLEKLKTLGKPVILSTGAKHHEDIRQALKYLGGVPVQLMYCSASYPAQEVDLGMIAHMRDMFHVPVGFSDHTTDVLVIPTTAVLDYHAETLEKHVTAIPEIDTPDRPHSLTFDQFKRMVDAINGEESKPRWIKDGEQPMILRHNRRLIATRGIREGDTFTEGYNFGIYRSLEDDSHAYTPFLIDKVNGKTAAKPITAGKGIGPGDIV